MITRMRRMQNERGYSLVETLIAMAILGSVLISIMALFVMGRKNVYSGKQMTRAVAVGTRVLEDLALMTRADVQSAFALPGSTLAAVPIGDKTYNNSILRSTTADAGTALDVDGYLTRWNAIVTQQDFTRGRVSLVITPVDPGAGGAPSITGSPIYRIRVFVQWNEDARARTLILDTTKVDRTN